MPLTPRHSVDPFSLLDSVKGDRLLHSGRVTAAFILSLMIILCWSQGSAQVKFAAVTGWYCLLPRGLINA